MPGQEEDISPYATFHLLGMREEAKAAAAGNKNSKLSPPKKRQFFPNLKGYFSYNNVHY